MTGLMITHITNGGHLDGITVQDTELSCTWPVQSLV